MDKQLFIDRILETENLTDELEDADANWLLAWGTGQLDAVLGGVEDETAAGDRVNALMAVMRVINRIAGKYGDLPEDRLMEKLTELNGLYNQVFHPAGDLAFEPQNNGLQIAAAHLPELEPGGVVRYLANGDFQSAGGASSDHADSTNPK
jgi:hypothetical protein